MKAINNSHFIFFLFVFKKQITKEGNTMRDGLKSAIKYYQKNFLKLLFFYKRKKKGFTSDIYFNRCDGMKKSDALVEKHRVSLRNGKEGIICLYKFDSFMGKTAYGLHYDIIGYVGVKPIRSCSFFEFLKLYGLTIFDGRDI
jgi:hypothetical protein